MGAPRLEARNARGSSSGLTFFRSFISRFCFRVDNMRRYIFILFTLEKKKEGENASVAFIHRIDLPLRPLAPRRRRRRPLRTSASARLPRGEREDRLFRTRRKARRPLAAASIAFRARVAGGAAPARGDSGRIQRWGDVDPVNPATPARDRT